MIQNALLTSLTPLKNKNEINCWENHPFITGWPENIQQKKGDITRTIKKKQKRVRTAFSTDQLRALEKMYSNHKYIDARKRGDVAKTLKVGEKCIKVWFQNRRMKEKRESSESSNDSSSESVSIESHPVSASPPLQVIIDKPTTEQLNKFTQDTDNSYQLPTYNTNQVQSGYGAMVPSGFAAYFYNENVVYPTQYFPYDVNFSNAEGNQFGSEINSYWTGNQYPYYSIV